MALEWFDVTEIRGTEDPAMFEVLAWNLGRCRHLLAHTDDGIGLGDRLWWDKSGFVRRDSAPPDPPITRIPGAPPNG